MRRSAILLAVPLLLATACKSTDDDSAEPTEAPTATTSAPPATTAPGVTPTTEPDATTAPTEAPGTTVEAAPPTTESDIPAVVDERAPGVTDDAIKIGVVYPDFAALGDNVSINHGDYEQSYQAIIDGINAQGGIHGRQLVPVYAAVDPSSPTSTDEHCTRLTQDEQVFAAIGLFFGESVLCYVNINSTAVIGGEMTDERLAQARAPWFAVEGSDAQTDALAKLLDLGVIEGRVGVLISDSDRATYEERLVPLLDAAGVDIVELAVWDSGTPVENATAESITMFQRFQATGIDTLLALGQGTSNMVSDGVSGTGFKPQLVFNNTNGPNATAKDESRDPAVFDGAIAVGFFGPNDAILELDGMTRECFDVARAAGIEIPIPSTVTPGDPNTMVSVFAACQQLTILTTFLEEAGLELNYGTFQTAGFRHGELFVPGEPEPFFYGPPPSADGNRPVYQYVFDLETLTFVRG